MDEWTVILKTPTGIQFEIVEADFTEWTDDDKFLEFRNYARVKEMASAGAVAKVLG